MTPRGRETMRAHTVRGLASLVAGSLLVVTMSAVQAQAQTEVHVLVSFDESAGQNTEGMAGDRGGGVYVSVSPLGGLWGVPPGSAQPEPFRHVDGVGPGPRPGTPRGRGGGVCHGSAARPPADP